MLAAAAAFDLESTEEPIFAVEAEPEVEAEAEAGLDLSDAAELEAEEEAEGEEAADGELLAAEVVEAEAEEEVVAEAAEGVGARPNTSLPTACKSSAVSRAMSPLTSACCPPPPEPGALSNSANEENLRCAAHQLSAAATVAAEGGADAEAEY
jgi:hypothetical protein